VADVIARGRTARWNVERSRLAAARGRPPGPEGSVAKLARSDIARRSAAVHGALVGAAAMLSGPDSPLDGIVAEILVSVPGGSIAGGTDEIQKNIVGERALGLPREPSVDADIPFSQVLTNRRPG
jgi:alkylation response protein AidB-like acyl-CoA dehydrogenase